MNKRIGIRNELIVYLFVALVCLSLTYYLINKSNNYSCNQCSIEFKSRLPISNFENIINISISKLYDSYENGSCLIKWDKNQGYYRG